MQRLVVVIVVIVLVDWQIDNSDKQGIEKKIKNVYKKIYLPLLC